MANIYDIAKAAGVSNMTVSRVLNHQFEYRRPTYAKRAAHIRKIASEMGYRPNAAARSVRTGRHNAVSLVMSEDISCSILPQGLLQGLQAGCRDRRLNLMVSQMPDDRLVDEAYVPRILRESHVDGLLINYNAGIPPQMVELIGHFDITAVWLNSQQSANCIYPDDHGAAADATRRLLELGHRRIAYLDYTSSIHRPAMHYSFVERWEGCRQTMEEAGLTVRRHGSVEMLDRKWRLLEEIKALLAGPVPGDRPTALLCYGTREARTAIVAAIALGLDVPRDLSIVMFADNGSHDEMGIRIATSILPDGRLGRTAIDMLEQRIADPDLILDPVKVPFGFKAEQTLAPPPQREG